MVQINETYFVDIDPLNYTLKRKTPGKSKEGEDVITIKTIGHYGDLKSCILSALKDDYSLELSKGDYSLKEAVEVINNSINEFTKLLNELIKED